MTTPSLDHFPNIKMAIFSGCYSNPIFWTTPIPNLTQGPQTDAPIPSYSISIISGVFYVPSWSLHRWQNGNDPLIRDLMDTTRSYYWIVYPKCYQLWTIMIIDSMDIKWYQYGHGPCSNESALVGTWGANDSQPRTADSWRPPAHRLKCWKGLCSLRGG
jgi:hypothetical protein